MKTTGAELQSEAAIYSDGTGLTADELVRLYGGYCLVCEEAGEEPDDFQRWAEGEGHGGVTGGAEEGVATTLLARWMGDQYVVVDTGTNDEWYSADGDNWVDQAGVSVTHPAFAAASIVLCGGHRDGETVG